MRNLLILCLFLVGFQCALAAVVTNQNTPLYANPNQSSQPLTILQSGSQVSLLKTNLQTGYSLVKTAAGQQGWLLTSNLNQQQVVTKKPGFLTRVWADITGKKSSTTPVEAKLAVTQTATPSVQTATKQAMKPATKETANPSKSTPEMLASNQTLATEVTQLQQQVSVLQAEQHQQLYWFIWGAVVAFISLFIGIFLGWRKQKKRARSLFH